MRAANPVGNGGGGANGGGITGYLASGGHSVDKSVDVFEAFVVEFVPPRVLTTRRARASGANGSSGVVEVLALTLLAFARSSLHPCGSGGGGAAGGGDLGGG